MRRITIADFHAELKAQGVERIDFAFRCPMCDTIQSMRDFVRAGAKSEQAENQIAFSCVGRWTGAPSAFDGLKDQGCDWTLGGLFRLHKLEVIDPEDVGHPRFEPATPAEAQAHALKTHAEPEARHAV